MKKYNFLLFLQLLFFIIPTFIITSHNQQIPYKTHNNNTNNIAYRFYIIIRLNNAIKALRKMNLSIIPLPENTELLFTHPRIKNSLQIICKEKTFISLFALWYEIIQYRFINDEILINEFIKEIVIISHTALHNNTTKIYLHEDLSFESLIREKSTHKLLNYLDTIIDDITYQNNTSLPYHHTYEKYTDTQEQTINITVDDIIRRMYIIKRTNTYITFLKKYETYFFKNNNLQQELENHQNITQYKITNQIITEAIQEMILQKSISPIIDLWQDLYNYKYIGNKTLENEYITFIYTLFYIIYSTINKNNLDKNKIEIIAYKAQTINDLELEEILYIIDMIATELPEIINTYQINSSINWKDWLRKYWLLAPLSLITLYVKIWYLYNNHNYTESHSKQSL